MDIKISEISELTDLQPPINMALPELAPLQSKAGDTNMSPSEMPLVEARSEDSVDQGRVEDGANPPVKPIQLDSLLTLLKEIPGFKLQDSTYQFRRPILGTAVIDIFKKTNRISRVLLTDLDKDSISPNVFVRLALLRNPAGYLFPRLSEIAINNGNTFLEFLSVFISPALQQLEITGVDKATETSLAAFLETSSAEAAKLASVYLDGNVLSQKTVEYLAKYSHLKTLHLIDTLSAFDFHLLETLGRIKTLEDFYFCQSNCSVGYRSQATIHAETEADRLAQEKERRRDTEEQERKRLEMVREKEAREKKRQEQIEKDKERAKTEEAKNMLQKLGPRGAELATKLDSSDLQIVTGLIRSQPLAQVEVLDDVFNRGQAQGPQSDLPTVALVGKKKKKYSSQMAPSSQRLPVEKPVSYPTVSKERSSTLKPAETFYANLKALRITGPPMLVKDLVDINRASSLEKLVIVYIEDAIQPTDNAQSDLLTYPSDVARLVISRWTHSITWATMDVEKLSTARRSSINLSGAIFEQLLTGFSLCHLELKGWLIEGLDTTLRTFPPPPPFIPSLSKLEYLSLPSHDGATGLDLTDLQVFAETFPNINTLQCLLKPILAAPTPSSGWPSKTARNSNFRSITVEEDLHDTPHPNYLDIFNTARYIDHLFPKLSVLKALEGSKQNIEKWETIGKMVKMLQEVRLDERKDILEQTS